MSYFAPYLDETGLHVPTYAERMEGMLAAYRGVFGQEINLAESSPDYQLMSIFARALDDFTAVLVSLFASRNPGYATGAALDVLLPLHGISRVAGETDASARNRFALAASGHGRTIAEGLADAIAAVPNVAASRLIVNDSDAADANGIPGHSICAVVQGGNMAAIGKVLFDKKAPGIGTYGANSAVITDAFGQQHTVYFQRSASSYVTVTIRLSGLTGFDEGVILPAIRQAVMRYVSGLGIGQDLVVPALYGVCYSAEQAEVPTFSVTQILALVTGGTATSGVLAAGWKERFVIPSDSFINVVIS